MRSHSAGCERCNHDSFVAVNAATGTLPTASAHASAPPNCSISHPASGADSVSFQSLAGWDGPVVGVESHHAVLLSGHADRLDS